MKTDIRSYELVVHTEQEVRSILREGNRIKDRIRIVENTPISNLYNVRYEKSGRDYHTYYFYDLDSDKCVGAFALETAKPPKSLRKQLKKKPLLFIPHIDLSPSERGKGVASLCYLSFLLKKPVVFLTDHHSKDAMSLWDRLGKNPKLSSKFLTSKREIYRLLGRKEFFLR